MTAETFVQIQRALAEPKRVEVLEIIRRKACENGATCSSVLEEMSISQSTFSHHISEMMKAGVIRGRKDGRLMLLTLDEALINQYLDELREKILGKM